jgi:hypothetical protein
VGRAGEGTEAKDPFKVPRETIVQKVKTIGVMPLALSVYVPDADGLVARYEAAVVASLQTAGFSVVPPAAMRDIRERLKKTIGGLYDPMTGAVIAEKLKAYIDYSDSEYREKHPVDARLYIAVVHRQAQGGSTTATWDGVTDSSSGRNAVLSFISGAGGWVPTLSFHVVLADVKGDVLYSNYGGLQVVAYGRAGLAQHIDPKYIMSDPARDARARAIALGPLLGVSDPASTAKIAFSPAETSHEPEPLRVSRWQLLSKYRTVALAPLELPEMAPRKDLEQRYRLALEKKLTQLGYKVVGGDGYGEAWQAAQVAVGGFFDPYTGLRDESRSHAARAQVFAQLQQRYGITAVVYPAIVTRSAAFGWAGASWDGASYSVPMDKPYAGQILAYSLQVEIADGAETTLFMHRGGIQVAMGIIDGRPVMLPEGQLFSDPARDTHAVEIALAPLAPG